MENDCDNIAFFSGTMNDIAYSSSTMQKKNLKNQKQTKKPPSKPQKHLWSSKEKFCLASLPSWQNLLPGVPYMHSSSEIRIYGGWNMCPTDCAFFLIRISAATATYRLKNRPYPP